MSIVSFAKKRKLLSGILASALVLFLFISVLQILNYEKISKGVWIGDQNLSGLDFSTANEKIKILIDQMEGQPLEVAYKNQRWTVLPENLGVDLDTTATFQAVRSAGHHDNLIYDAAEQTMSLLFWKTRRAGFFPR